MLINEGVTLEGQNLILVPYTKELVEQYHSWFVNDPELLEATCSDLLTLEEEYVNQESWRTDECKLTFLIRDRTETTFSLCGDINAFFSDHFEQDWIDSDEYVEDPIPSGKVAEINLMIAEKSSRRKGIAEEAMRIFTEYMVSNISNLRLLVAKIQLGNLASIKLFEKLGFVKFNTLECFNEVHYIKRLD
jgi:RimJ/RimL family protein N-acetyltransferase